MREVESAREERRKRFALDRHTHTLAATRARLEGGAAEASPTSADHDALPASDSPAEGEDCCASAQDITASAEASQVAMEISVVDYGSDNVRHSIEMTTHVPSP